VALAGLAAVLPAAGVLGENSKSGSCFTISIPHATIA